MALTLPMPATMAGVDVVIVSAAEYAQFKPAYHGRIAGASLSADAILDALVNRRGQKSPVLYDREVALFLIDAIGTKPDASVLTDAIAKFGAERAPSSTTLNRIGIAVRHLRSSAQAG